jgi:hypothetical protein
MLLSNAAVDSVEDGVLTVRFAREGDMKGFSSSGCDRDLGQVLATGFGFKLQVRSVFGAQPGSPPAGYGQHSQVPSASAPAQPGQPDDLRPGHSDPVASGPVPSGPVPSDLAQAGTAQSDPARSDAVQSDAAPAGAARPDAQSGPARSGRPPTDRAPAALTAREDLTGMDLIKRELGGKIIAEIDEA